MKINVDTIIIYVQDVDRLKAFYVDIFGLTIVEEHQSEWALLDACSAKIGLHKIGDEYSAKIMRGYKFSNNTKIVFDIDEDIRGARQSLIDQNVLMRAVKTFDNYDFWLCDGEDPEGNVFQLKQRKQLL